MLSILASLVISQAALPIERTNYGVPVIRAQSFDQAFEAAGYAVAQDRLWQMEMSRRLARGQMAEVMGRSALASDQEALKLGYTVNELQNQLRLISAEGRQAYAAYARGVNRWIQEAQTAKKLPAGYEKNGFAPRPWEVEDSIAITINLFRLFGQGGAGELRNMALLMYLQARPNKEQALDIFDDFLWENDSRSPTTIAPSDDPLRANPPKFAKRNRQVTQKHLDLLPKFPLSELLPAITLASRESSTLLAMQNNVPYKTGSYAIIVDGKRSATGYPLLLSAPQMGHQQPSVVHEMMIDSPEYKAVGMNVPGVPGIAIGHTPHLAWALTSGVADTNDMYFNALGENNTYLYGGKALPLDVVPFTVKVKGGDDVNVVQMRTRFGPVILNSKSQKVVVSQKSSQWGLELKSVDAMLAMGKAKSISDVEAGMRNGQSSFNAFVAMKDGTIGYRYVGNVPVRSEGADPRFPLPGAPEFEWKGMISYEQMPHMQNPKSGMILNWNNKPVSWWPNMDTPVWGRTFRNVALIDAMNKPSIGVHDVELGAWTIARREFTAFELMPHVRKALGSTWLGLSPVAEEGRKTLSGWNGWKTEGSAAARIYFALLDEIRREVFLKTTGNFISDANFRTVAQFPLILEALEGKTKVDYRAGRSIESIIRTAFEKTMNRLDNPAAWRFEAGKIAIEGEAPIPYSDRGTYIQVIELAPSGVRGRNVVSPGVAETGPHSKDQAPLARAWMYKAMPGW